MKIILTARDAESCAGFLDALGIGLQRDRHGVFHGSSYIHLELRGREKPFSARIAADDPAESAKRLIRAGGSIVDRGERAGDGLTEVVGPNGERLTLTRASTEPRPLPPFSDVGQFYRVSGWLDPNLAGLRAAMARVGASNPRILGPVALGGEPGDDYTLVVDADGDVDLAHVEAFIAGIRDGRVGLRVALASALPVDRREYLEDIAWRR